MQRTVENSKELQRLKNVLSSDRSQVSKTFLNLLENDIEKVVSAYFELKNMPKAEINAENQEVYVNTTFKAKKLKSVGIKV